MPKSVQNLTPNNSQSDTRRSFTFWTRVLRSNGTENRLKLSSFVDNEKYIWVWRQQKQPGSVSDTNSGLLSGCKRPMPALQMPNSNAYGRLNLLMSSGCLSERLPPSPALALAVSIRS